LFGFRAIHSRRRAGRRIQEGLARHITIFSRLDRASGPKINGTYSLTCGDIRNARKIL
jgi:hypothetical protein